jgi:hypothetical protein
MRNFLNTLLLLVFAAVSPCLNAQRTASGYSHFGGSYNRGGHARSSFFPLAFSDLYYSNDLFSTGYPVASQPPVIVLQVPWAATAAPERPSQTQPLMIELQGDRYVQVSGGEMSGASGAQMIGSERTDPIPHVSRQRERASAGENPAVVANQMAPAVLVFHDGHREEVSEYTIADGALYTSGDPYSGGSWNRKIELSSLNLPETIKSNQSRGVRFQLPAAPNEVIVGP